MNHQSKKAEKLEPQDSERKPEGDNEAVVKPEDLEYHHEDADFKDVAKKREQGEQPVDPVKDPPKDV